MIFLTKNTDFSIVFSLAMREMRTYDAALVSLYIIYKEGNYCFLAIGKGVCFWNGLSSCARCTKNRGEKMQISTFGDIYYY